jgi:hypothetical protein
MNLMRVTGMNLTFMSDKSTIHLNVPAELKGRWVRASRTAGMRLTDFIVNAVEDYMQRQLANITIPDTVTFSDLKLARDADGMVSFDWSPVEIICNTSNVAVEILKDGPEDNVSGLIIAWYESHLANGGQRDPVADDIIGETIIEQKHGQTVSHAPGKA